MAITIYEITIKGTLYQNSSTKPVDSKPNAPTELAKLMVEDLAKKAKGKNER